MSEEIEDLRQVGVSQASRALLDQMKRQGHIDDLLDGYRLAILTAVAFGREPRAQRESGRTTMFAAGNLDPDQALKTVIVEMHPAAQSWPYRAAEDLAEQGLEILKDSFE